MSFLDELYIDKIEIKKKEPDLPRIDEVLAIIHRTLKSISNPELQVKVLIQLCKKMSRYYIPCEEKPKYILVRILRDLPPFIGVDGKIYRGLTKGTIAYIPEENARILIRNGDAERVYLHA